MASEVLDDNRTLPTGPVSWRLDTLGVVFFLHLQVEV